MPRHRCPLDASTAITREHGPAVEQQPFANTSLPCTSSGLADGPQAAGRSNAIGQEQRTVARSGGGKLLRTQRRRCSRNAPGRCIWCHARSEYGDEFAGESVGSSNVPVHPATPQSISRVRFFAGMDLRTAVPHRHEQGIPSCERPGSRSAGPPNAALGQVGAIVARSAGSPKAGRRAHPTRPGASRESAMIAARGWRLLSRLRQTVYNLCRWPTGNRALCGRALACYPSRGCPGDVVVVGGERVSPDVDLECSEGEAEGRVGPVGVTPPTGRSPPRGHERGPLVGDTTTQLDVYGPG
jgi:hypothetical protein